MVFGFERLEGKFFVFWVSFFSRVRGFLRKIIMIVMLSWEFRFRVVVISFSATCSLLFCCLIRWFCTRLVILWWGITSKKSS